VGHAEGSRPARKKHLVPASFWYTAKRRLLGPPMVNDQLREQRLAKTLALGVLSPDGISSPAYGLSSPQRGDGDGDQQGHEDHRADDDICAGVVRKVRCHHEAPAAHGRGHIRDGPLSVRVRRSSLKRDCTPQDDQALTGEIAYSTVANE
jgi:hypothetical protein